MPVTITHQAIVAGILPPSSAVVGYTIKGELLSSPGICLRNSLVSLMLLWASVMVVIFDPSFLPGGFILACEDFWENVRPSTCRLRFLLVCFVLKRR